jgi:TrmH family RNA methyltransferase
MDAVTDLPTDPAAAVATARRDPAWVVLEGVHAVKHAARFGASLELLVTPDAAALARLLDELAPDLAGLAADEVPAALWDRLTDGGLPSPALGLCRRPEVDVTAVLADPSPAPVVLLEGPTHLGNVGAVVRVAAAAAAAGVLVTGRTDPWHPAAVRGGAGLQLAVPTARLDDLAPVLDDDHRRPVVCLDADGEPLRPGVVPPRALLAFGTERHGLSPDLRDRADLTVAIPMRPGVSSLNLATAVAVTLYSGS